MSTTVDAPQRRDARPRTAPPQPQDLTKLRLAPRDRARRRRRVRRRRASSSSPSSASIFALSVVDRRDLLLPTLRLRGAVGPDARKRLLELRVLMRDGRPGDREAPSPCARRRGSSRTARSASPSSSPPVSAAGAFGDLLSDTIVARPAPGLPRAGFSPLADAVPAAIAAGAVARRARLLRALRAPGLPASPSTRRARATPPPPQRHLRAGHRRDRRPHGRRAPLARRGRDARQRAQAPAEILALDARVTAPSPRRSAAAGAADARPRSPPSATRGKARRPRATRSSACAPAPAFEPRTPAEG